MRSQQIIPVIKHFPGHGDTSTDSHLELPLVQKSLEELRRFELIPFAEAINHGADIVMIAHDVEYQIKVIHSLIDAVKQGIIQEETIDNSVYRILQLKEQYQLSNDPTPNIHIDAINADIQNVLNLYL